MATLHMQLDFPLHVELVLVLKPLLVLRVDLTGLANNQANSKHAGNGEKSQIHGGASDAAKILVDALYGCEGQPYKG